jgi:hypothetical protein
VSRYRWSVLWRAGDSSQRVSVLIDTARTLSVQLTLDRQLNGLLPGGFRPRHRRS